MAAGTKAREALSRPATRAVSQLRVDSGRDADCKSEAPPAAGAIESATRRVDTLVDRLNGIAGMLENNFDRLLGPRDMCSGTDNAGNRAGSQVNLLHDQISTLEHVAERLSSEALRIADL